MSKISDGKMSVHPQETDVAALIKHTVVDYLASAQQKGIGLRDCIDDALIWQYR